MDLPPKDGGLQAASDGGLGDTSWGGMDHGWHHERHSPVKNAVCKRWDTPDFLRHHAGAFGGSVAKFDFWAKSKNRLQEFNQEILLSLLRGYRIKGRA